MGKGRVRVEPYNHIKFLRYLNNPSTGKDTTITIYPGVPSIIDIDGTYYKGRSHSMNLAVESCRKRGIPVTISELELPLEDIDID